MGKSNGWILKRLVTLRKAWLSQWCLYKQILVYTDSRGSWSTSWTLSQNLIACKGRFIAILMIMKAKSASSSQTKSVYNSKTNYFQSTLNK